MPKHLAAEIFLIQPLLLSDSTLAKLLDVRCFTSRQFCVDEAVWSGWRRIKGAGRLQASGDQLVADHQHWLLAMAAAREYPLATCPGIQAAVDKQDLTREIDNLRQKLELLEPDLAIDVAGSSYSLFVDEFGLFSLVYNIQVVSMQAESNGKTVKHRCDYAGLVQSLRTLLEFRGAASWHRLIEAAATSQIGELLLRIFPDRKPEPSPIQVEANTGHVLAFFYDEFSGMPGNVHAAEETPEQYRKYPSFVQAYDGATGHFGFSNSTLSGIPRTCALACLPFCCYLQSSWYLIGFFRRYMMNLMSSLYETGSTRPLNELTREIDQIVLAYEKFILFHSRFLGSLRPWQREAALQLEQSWMIDNDLTLLKDTLATTRDYVERRYRAASEATELAQARALNVITGLQILTIISVTADYANLIDRNSWLHWVALFSTLSFLSIVLFFFVKQPKTISLVQFFKKNH